MCGAPPPSVSLCFKIRCSNQCFLFHPQFSGSFHMLSFPLSVPLKFRGNAFYYFIGLYV